MAGGRGPTVRARRLLAELRRLRAAAGLTTDEAGARTGMSGPKISRIEKGKVGFKTADIEKLLDVYGVKGKHRRELLEWAERAYERGWWQSYTQLTDATQTLIALETDATAISNFQPVAIPGLLQIAEYSRETIKEAGLGFTVDEIEVRVAARMARQTILTKADAPQLHLVLDEAVLHRVVGSTEVMRRQLRHLLDVAERPNITLQVIAFVAGPHASPEGSFLILEFGNGPEAVLLEGKTADLFLEEDHELDAYAATMRRLETQALAPDESVRLIANLIDRLE